MERGRGGRGRGRGRGSGRGRGDMQLTGAASGSKQWSSDSAVRSSQAQGKATGRGRGGAGGRGGLGGRGGGGRGRSGRGGGGTCGGGRGQKRQGGERDGAAVGGADELPANKKRRLKLERQQHRPQFDTVLRSKEIWNKLRERKISADERAKLVLELLPTIKGKVLAIALKHDASRVVQTALQFGNKEERMSVFAEIEGHIAELSQLAYSHFVVLRMLMEMRGLEEKTRVAKTFRGHTVRLATHAIGARVVQSALDSLPKTLAASIKSEFYGKEFAMFDDGEQLHSLKAVLTARPDRHTTVMQYVRNTIGQFLKKSLMQFEYTHDLLWEYIQEATPVEMQELVPHLVEPYMLLLSTRRGSMSAAMCAAHGGAKDRKRMMRALKGYVAASLLHRDAYMAVMTLVESVDDTILCQKTILAELLQPLKAASAALPGTAKPWNGTTTAEEWVPRGKTTPKGNAAPKENSEPKENPSEGLPSPVVMNPTLAASDMDVEGEAKGETGPAPPALLSIVSHVTGCKLLLRLLAPDHTGYLHPEELDLLKPTMVPASTPKSAAAVEGAAAGGEGTVTLVPSSKKEASVRRRELLAYLREPLRELCVAHAADLLRSKFAGSLVLQEVVRVIGTPQVVQAVAEAACAEPLENQLPMYEDPAGHLFMKQLLKREAKDQEGKGAAAKGGNVAADAADNSACFADALLKRAGDSLPAWTASNRGSFVVAALDAVPSARAGVRKVMTETAVKAKLVKDAEGGKSFGVKVLAKQLGFGDFGDTKSPAPADAARISNKKNKSK